LQDNTFFTIVSNVFPQQPTYGSPRIGNNALAATISQQSPAQGRNFRVVHKNDPVVSWPSRRTYAHVTPSFMITPPAGTVPTINDITIQNGTIHDWSPAFNYNTTIGATHSWYMNQIDACAHGNSTGATL
jgi:hypothetical protein